MNMLPKATRSVHTSARAAHLTLKQAAQQPAFNPVSIGLPADFLLTSIASFKG